jgi:plasmid stability protein
MIYSGERLARIERMNLIIELPDGDATALKRKAQQRGVSAEAYARQILEQDLNQQNGGTAATGGPRISQVIAEIMADAPPEELAKLPKDGASEHDHYIYGWPKRDQ